MTATIIPFPVEQDVPQPTFAERLAARRAFRKGMKRVAEKAVGEAFNAGAKIQGAEHIGCDDAFPLFVAAMRRELRKSGLF